MEPQHDRQRRKKRKKTKQKRQGAESAFNQHATDATPAVGTDFLNTGLEIHAFADSKDLKMAEVWRLIRQGTYAARSTRGKMIVYESTPPRVTAKPADPIQNENLPPLDEITSGAELELKKSEGAYLGLDGSRSDNPEVALLLDHLSLAKEENREILRMTEESIKRVTEMTEQVVFAKNELLAEKQARLEEKNDEVLRRNSTIALLEERIKSQENDMRRLRKDVENLEILSRSLDDPS